SSISSIRQRKTIHLKLLSLVTFLILSRNVYTNCSHKSNYGIALLLSSSATCYSLPAKLR
ncbi:unnamed protein product, partial [Hymenolepis diminuta]